MQICPLQGYALIKETEPESKTTTGLIIPSEDEKHTIGEVLEFKDSTEEKCPIQKGDIVAYKKYTGNRIVDAGYNYYLVEFKDLIAIIKE
jgi:co-chaperonin GroES (HSP10)